MKLKIFLKVTPFLIFPCLAFSDMLLPKFEPGLHILDKSQIPTIPLLDSQKAKIAEEREQEKKLGYIECDDCSYIKLFWLLGHPESKNINAKIPPEMILEKSISDINLYFKFNEINFINKNDVIGFHSTGSLTQPNTWTGIVEGFNDSDMGTCFFKVHDLTSGHMSIFIDRNEINHRVNQKITKKINVNGRKKFGFVYSVEWFTNAYAYTLQCFSLDDFKPNGKELLINLAKKIDADVNLG